MAGKVVPIEVRFWRYVIRGAPEECWLWLGSITGGGYGQIWESLPTRKRHDAHRFSWTLRHGAVPRDLQVLHRCDVKHCVNPAHLYLGIVSQNTRDAIERGQKKVGSQCSFAKLTFSQVQQIRGLHASGHTNQELANQFHVSPTTIWRAYSGIAYKDVSAIR